MKTVYVQSPDLGFETIYMCFSAGAVRDPEGLEGLAQVTAEMMLRGTTTRTREQLAEEFEFLGSGSAINVGVETALLGFDANDRCVPELLALMEDVWLNPAFDSDELEHLRLQALSEIDDLRDNDSAACNMFFGEALYENHPYGHPMRGYSHSLKRIRRDDVADFFARYYGTRGMLLAGAGNLGESRFKEMMAQVTGHLPEGSDLVELPPEVVGPNGLDVLLVTREDRTQAQVAIGQRAICGSDPRLFPFKVGVNALGGLFTSPLVREIREKRGWSYGVSASMIAGPRTGSFKIRFAPRNQDVVPAIELALKMVEDWVARGPEPDSLSAAKKYMAQQYAFTIDTPISLLDQKMHVIATGRRPDYLERFPELVMAVSGEEAHAAFSSIILPKNLTVVVLGHPSLEAGLAAIPGVRRLRVVPVSFDEPLPRE